MKETKKNAVLRVFQTARCSSARYIIGVACSSVSILLSGVPFYTIYQIVRIFLEASLNNTAVDVSAAWLWAGITLASIAVGIVLSIIGSFVCHSCAFHALYDLRMRILNHMGRLNLGFFTGGQSGAVQKTMNDISAPAIPTKTTARTISSAPITRATPAPAKSTISGNRCFTGLCWKPYGRH